MPSAMKTVECRKTMLVQPIQTEDVVTASKLGNIARGPGGFQWWSVPKKAVTKTGKWSVIGRKMFAELTMKSEPTPPRKRTPVRRK